MRKEVVNWAQAAKDRVPCYFWYGDKRPENPCISSLIGYCSDHVFPFITGSDSDDMEHCEFILPSDKEKYTEIVYEGRDNFIKALKEDKLFYCKQSSELIEIAERYGYEFVNSSVKSSLNVFSEIFFRNKYINLKERNFPATKYLPETDSFEKPEPKYRACKNFEEFKTFWGKIATVVGEEKYVILDTVSFENDNDVFWTAEDFLSNFELLEPINGSKIIGVIDED